MSASEITSINVAHGAGHTFNLYKLRYRLRATQLIVLPTGASANILRGGIGKLLRREGLNVYQRYFAPSTPSGPSGLRDSPRPFVLRAAHLDGVHLTPGDEFEIGINLFETREPPLDLFERVASALLPATLVHAKAEPIQLNLDSASVPVRRIRVRFLAPTEIKGSERPDFPILFARIRDRISTLRGLYGAGPLNLDFKAIGERAQLIEMTRCELQQIAAERESRGTGQRHPLNGFIGEAEYEGDLAEFVPYLEAAHYTGVGRQTVWGKGEIATEIL